MQARRLLFRSLGVLAALVCSSFAHAAYVAGDVFASIGNGQVNRYSSAGVLLQTLNTGQGGFTTGSAFDSAGNFYVTNFGANTLSKFDNNGTLVSGAFVSGFDSSPESIVFDASGNFYVGQADGTADIRKFSAAGVLLASYDVGTTARGSDWIDLAADQKTMYYTSENNEIKRFDLSTNTQLTDFGTGTRPKFALRILADGGVLVASSGVIERYDSTGAIIQTYNPPGSNAFALNLDGNGTSFWTGDFGNGNLTKWNIATGVQEFTINTGSGGLFGVSIFGEISQGCAPNCGGGGNVPEPASLILVGSALLGLALQRRRKA